MKICFRKFVGHDHVGKLFLTRLSSRESSFLEVLEGDAFAISKRMETPAKRVGKQSKNRKGTYVGVNLHLLHRSHV